jgi:two-component system sensor histidine kinase KdpD
MERPDIDLRRWAFVGAAIVGSLAIVTAIVATLENRIAVPDASSAYLLAVVVVAVAFGTTPAIVTAVGAFLLYDFLFTQPLYSLTVHDPREWLNLLLLLVIGAIVGRLAGQQRDRAETALAREREARALYGISFTLANTRDIPEALASIAGRLRDETRMSRVWITLADAVVADAPGDGSTRPQPAAPPIHATLRRRPGDQPAEWVRVHVSSRGPKRAPDAGESAYRVAVAAGEQSFGSLWASRPRDIGHPDAGETRVLAAAADQIGGSLERDRLLREATSAEISRRSDALKSALLDSVSHDLRTPLASIRAAAGTLMDPEVSWPEDQRREIAASIDREAEWLNRLVTNLLDMSRIEAGELKPSLAVFDVSDLVDQAVRRTAPSPARAVTLDMADDLPPVLADEVFIGQVLANTLDNAAKYAGPTAPIAVSARQSADGMVRITVEDGGPGVPAETIPRLFEKFYRVPRTGEGSRRGTGIGLSVVRGLVDAMGGHVAARPSSLGGLAIDVDLPAAAVPSPG